MICIALVLGYLSGYLYCEARKTVNALIHMEEAFDVFCALCTPRKVCGPFLDFD